MKFSAAAVLAAAAGAQAWSNVTYTTEVVTALTTYCPFATQVTHNGQTYTVTEATTLTITNCPCTVTKPVSTTSSVVCNTCGVKTTTSAAAPTTTKSVGTISASATKPTTVPTAGAGKVAALSGAGLAGVLGLAAFVL